MDDWNRRPIHGSSTGHLAVHGSILLITSAVWSRTLSAKSATVASKAGPSELFRGFPQLEGALRIVYKLCTRQVLSLLRTTEPYKKNL